MSRSISILLSSAAAALTFVTTAPTLAQTASPASTPAEPALCTDRPSKANAPCTVPAGDFQIEADVANGTRSSADGVTVKTLLGPNPTFKYGVNKSLDVELNIAPWQQVQTTAGGRTLTDASLSDLFLRAKWAAVTGDVFNMSLLP